MREVSSDNVSERTTKDAPSEMSKVHQWNLDLWPKYELVPIKNRVLNESDSQENLFAAYEFSADALC